MRENSFGKSALVTCFSDLFAYVCHFQRTLAVAMPAVEEVRARVQTLLAESEQKARELGFSEDEIKLAKFAVCAWIDELMMNVNWPHREAWKRNLLQTEYFKTTNAGEEFFHHLNRLRPEQNDVREVFYLCLCLGFRGRYCHPGDELIISQLKQAQLNFLIGAQKGDFRTRVLIPDAYPPEDEASSLLLAEKEKKVSREMMILAAAPAFLFLILFIVYTFVLKGRVDDILGPLLG